MAIPLGLYKIEMVGRWEYAQPIPLPLKTLFKWAMTLYVEFPFQVDDPILLGAFADALRDHFLGVGMATKHPSQGTVVESMYVVRPSNGYDFLDNTETVIGGAPIQPPVPAQCAVLAVGRTAAMGRQTRKWIPCVSSGLLYTDRPEWNLLAGPDSLRQWATDFLLPYDVFGFPMTPVVWDAENEIARPIVEVLLSPMPRTVRRRSLRDTAGLVKTFPL